VYKSAGVTDGVARVRTSTFAKLNVKTETSLSLYFGIQYFVVCSKLFFCVFQKFLDYFAVISCFSI